jgi:Zn-finger nucleic acid-binding protein
MKCPVCSINLQMSQQNGIEIDHCPKCRGICLDSSEASEIIKSMPLRIRETGPVLHADSEKTPFRKRKSFFRELAE